MMPRESGRLRRRLAIVTALLVGSASGASLTSLSARDADKMKSVLYGGACWRRDARDAKLPSGKSTRAGIAGRPRGTRCFVAANGEARAVAVEEYAVVDGQTATPDHRRLAKHVADAGAPPRPTTLAAAADFKAKCAEKRHCLAVFVNGSRSDAATCGLQAGRGEARATRRTPASRRDAKTLVVRRQGAPGGAATALYLRRLNANEKAALAAAAAKLPAASGRRAFDAARRRRATPRKSADDADRNFEAKRLAPRDWAGAGDAAETLVFRSSGVYLSRRRAPLSTPLARADGAIPEGARGEAPSPRRPPPPRRRAFRGGDFGAEAAGAGTPTKPPTKAAKAQAARDKAEARAEREREARAKMEADAEEHIPQTVDIADDGDASWHVDDGDGDDEDDDDEDDDEDEDYEMI
ncbi:hypothetical protein JL722_13635 [Aureococcus anophagefferens]|nr:hypothetical protein JL722_13635 [Aureococcus anophagefferens]